MEGKLLKRSGERSGENALPLRMKFAPEPCERVVVAIAKSVYRSEQDFTLHFAEP